MVKSIVYINNILIRELFQKQFSMNHVEPFLSPFLQVFPWIPPTCIVPNMSARYAGIVANPPPYIVKMIIDAIQNPAKYMMVVGFALASIAKKGIEEYSTRYSRISYSTADE